MSAERGPVGGAGELTALVREVKEALAAHDFSSADPKLNWWANRCEELLSALAAKAPWQPEPGAEQLSLAYWREKLQAAEQQNIELEFQLSRAREAAKAPQGVAATDYRCQHCAVADQLQCVLDNGHQGDCMFAEWPYRPSSEGGGLAANPGYPAPESTGGPQKTTDVWMIQIRHNADEWLNFAPSFSSEESARKYVDEVVRYAACICSDDEHSPECPLAAPPAPSLPVPGPVSDTTIHHGPFPPSSPRPVTSWDCICPTYSDGPAYTMTILKGCPWHNREAAAVKPAPADHSRCSLCGAPRIALNRAGTLFGACTLTECKDPLHDFRVENPQTEANSRSQQKRVAAMKGEPELGIKPIQSDIALASSAFQHVTPAPGAEGLCELDKLIGHLCNVREGNINVAGNHAKTSNRARFADATSRYEVLDYVIERLQTVREALAAAPPATSHYCENTKNIEMFPQSACSCGAPTDIESLAATFHGIYQQEAKRQGDVRHKDAYADLPDNVKEFDRVLARYVLANFGDRHASAERVRELIAKWRKDSTLSPIGDSTRVTYKTLGACADELERALPPSTGEKS